MTVETLRAIVENPSLAHADRDAARSELARLEAASNQENGQEGPVSRPSHPLEFELLESANCVRLANVPYGDIHRFCVERDWSAEPRSLYFEHWLPEYSAETEWGQRQLAAVIDYFSRDGRSADPELTTAIQTRQVLQEVRRRFKADPDFAALFTAEKIAEFGLDKEGS